MKHEWLSKLPIAFQKDLIALSGCNQDNSCSFPFHTSLQVFFKVISGYRPAVPQDMPDGYVTLMKACWNKDPNERPPFEDIVKYLRSLYLELKNSSGQSRDPRRSLDLNPWG